MNTKLFTLVLASIFLTFTVSADIWETFNTSNSSIPGNGIRAVQCDNNSNTWIGTAWNGVTMFDGQNWTTYNTMNSGLPVNGVLAIAFDGNGNKWFGTDGGGLVMYDGNNWTTYTTMNSGLPTNKVTSIAIDQNGNIWLGTDMGLVKFDGNSNWTTYNTGNSGLSSNQIEDIVISGSGMVWMATYGGGMVKFDMGTSWYAYKMGNSPILGNLTYAIAIDKNGNVWCGTCCGLNVFDGTYWIEHHSSGAFMLHYIESITFDNNGNVWAGMADGLAKYNGSYWEPFTINNSALPGNSIMSIAVGSNGDKWIGTNSTGLVNIRSGTSAITENSFDPFGLSVMPNPSDGQLNISFDLTDDDLTLRVIDLLGNEVYFDQENNVQGAYNRSLDLNFLSNGVYLLQLKSGDAITQRKIILY